MAKPELGTKRLCGGCGAKFYDLGRNPIVCPKCATVFVVAPPARSRAEPAAARVVEPVMAVPETKEAEFVSLEEADTEAQGKKAPAAEGEDVEVEEDASLDDAGFIVPEEEEEDDVTDIIGSDIEDEEET